MPKNTTSPSLFILGWLLLFTSNVAIPAELQKKSIKPVNWFTEEQAIAQAISYNHENRLATHEDEIVHNKNALEDMGIAQHRISESMRRLEGKSGKPIVIESHQYEIPDIFALLDNVLAEINARQLNDRKLYQKAKKQRTNEKIIQTIVPLYWQAAGAKAVSPKVQRLINKAKKQLEPFIYAREEKPVAQKNEMLHLLEELKRIQARNSAALSELSSTLGIDNTQAKRLRFNAKQDMSIPELDINLQQMDSQTLSLQNASTPIKLVDLKKYLLSTTPGLSYDWQGLSKKNIAPWLSTGKNLAFDLYNHLNKLERVFLLKEKPDEKAKTEHLTAAAMITRSRLAYVQYQQDKAIYTLSTCIDSIGSQLNLLESEILDRSVDSVITRLKQEKRQIEHTLQTYQKYAALQLAFNNLKQSVSNGSLPEQLESQPVNTIAQTVSDQLKKNKKLADLDSFSCYTSAEEKSLQEKKTQSLMAEKEKAQQKTAQPVKKKTAVVKKATPINTLANSWLSKQNPRSYTLQILSHSNKDKLFSYIKKYRLGKQARVIKTRYRGKTFYALLYGLYGDRELAYIAQFKLPDNVQDQNQILIRRISEVQKMAR